MPTPTCLATACTAAVVVGYSDRCSNTRRNARAFSSGSITFGMNTSSWTQTGAASNLGRFRRALKLVQAHYADAIQPSLIKREQDRSSADLAQITRRIDAHFGDYADARAHLDDALDLLANCADIYRRCDDTNRRLCNQAFFTKVFIDEDNELRVEHNRPFEMLLDPKVNANALTWAADADNARTSTNVSVGKGSSLVREVEHRGFEPLTSSMPWKRATNCANAPRLKKSSLGLA